jgi:hypothetical protein
MEGRFPIPEIQGEIDGRERVKLAGSCILLQYIIFMVMVSCGFCGIPWWKISTSDRVLV